MKTSSPFVDLDGNAIPNNQVLGYGRSGLVVFRDGMAVKMPLRYMSTTDDDVNINIEVIQREQDVYRRLRYCDGVVPCISTSKATLQLEFMKNGDLRTYLARNRPLSPFNFCDIASRNFLLASDLSIYLCDFTESSILPLGTDMETVDDNGYSVQTDIGLLGAVIYEIVTGERCQFDLFKDLPLEACRATWPQRTSLPSTQNIWLGAIIEKCWTKGAFQNANRLSEALDSINLNDQSTSGNERYDCCEPGKKISSQYIFKLAVAFGAITIIAIWVWRWSSVIWSSS
ncbi:serine/threonine protein kinase [Emergomyces pasteurianus Ep9510]|uniref:Serine/threonine protein kinase n=1 Tax=Emergomyces pasteurianus Ep9510 TaxID=1447872 RepID=A0A1J9PTA6_9EURO|nr:serine/threonine protein kinase [Emergomyces pasteurianus Ep9510]